MNSNTGLILQWNLSASVAEILSYDLELCEYLIQERKKPAFTSHYHPTEIEVWYDYELCICIQDGLVTYLCCRSLKNLPTFVEVRFDQQLAMFVIQGEVIVDRTPETVILTQLVTHFKQIPPQLE